MSAVMEETDKLLNKKNALLKLNARAMRWRRMLRPMMSRRGTPEAIALGAAIGFFIAFTPTIGFQLVLAALLATLMKANRPAALIPVWITNPFTIPPIYAFTYQIGALFMTGPAEGRVRIRLIQVVRGLGRHEIYDLSSQFREFARIGAEMFVPMLIGGLLVGLLAGIIAYPIVLRLVRRYRAHRLLAREKKRERRAARREAMKD